MSESERSPSEKKERVYCIPRFYREAPSTRSASLNDEVRLTQHVALQIAHDRRPVADRMHIA